MSKPKLLNFNNFMILLIAGLYTSVEGDPSVLALVILFLIFYKVIIFKNARILNEENNEIGRNIRINWYTAKYRMVFNEIPENLKRIYLRNKYFFPNIDQTNSVNLDKLIKRHRIIDIWDLDDDKFLEYLVIFHLEYINYFHNLEHDYKYYNQETWDNYKMNLPVKILKWDFKMYILSKIKKMEDTYKEIAIAQDRIHTEYKTKQDKISFYTPPRNKNLISQKYNIEIKQIDDFEDIIDKIKHDIYSFADKGMFSEKTILDLIIVLKILKSFELNFIKNKNKFNLIYLYQSSLSDSQIKLEYNTNNFTFTIKTGIKIGGDFFNEVKNRPISFLNLELKYEKLIDKIKKDLPLERYESILKKIKDIASN